MNSTCARCCLKSMCAISLYLLRQTLNAKCSPRRLFIPGQSSRNSCGERQLAPRTLAIYCMISGSESGRRRINLATDLGVTIFILTQP